MSVYTNILIGFAVWYWKGPRSVAETFF